ncbi:hypothetical protein PFISCL1PPCAC_5221 [Pristionchus fissidentatus]|uniref:BZIP domain-containing protein n=1 Tax=Pristionchus fissidentatus TaxID=1538716 RepID=A0AAV5V3B4_9BILA|nr:hypothetical protein PFISCL1PPCAC_5221 [Pristionchus fissidentatus]
MFRNAEISPLAELHARTMTSCGSASVKDPLKDALSVMKIDLKEIGAAKNIPNLDKFWGIKCPTTSPSNVFKPPLPLEEPIEFPPIPPPISVVPFDIPTAIAVDSTQQSERDAAETCPSKAKKRRRGYILKTDAQRGDLKYKRERESNNKSVDRWRQKKQKEEEETKKRNEEQKELLRSTLKKVIEMHELPIMQAEFHSKGRILKRPLPEGLGVMNEDQMRLYKEIRRELENLYD